MKQSSLVIGCMASFLWACAGSGTGPSSPPPPPPVWIQPATMAGTWSYRSYYMYQAGCWPEGGGTACLLDSTLEAFTGTIVIALPRDSLFGATFRAWKVPFHMEIHVQQWDVAGACNGAPLSCFTARAPTADFVETHDSLFEIGQDGSQPAQLMLRSGRGQWLWHTTVVAPVRLYDSLAAAAPPASPGVRELQKLP